MSNDEIKKKIVKKIKLKKKMSTRVKFSKL